MKPLIRTFITLLGLPVGMLAAQGSETIGTTAAQSSAEQRLSRSQTSTAERRTTTRYFGSGTTTISTTEKRTARLGELYEKGRALYEQGDIPGAHAVFEEMLAIEPGNVEAQTYLDNMQAEWDRYLENKRLHEEQRTEEQKGQELLNTPITIETLRPQPLNDFLNNLSFASGMNFNIASGVEAQINNVKFIDTPLVEVLDAVLVPMGLKWHREDGVVIVEPALESRVFHFSRTDINRVKTLYSGGTLQRILWGPDAQPDLVGESMVLDERDLALLATDSRQRLDKLGALLRDLNNAIVPSLETRIYKIQSDAGPKIRALIDAVINTKASTPFDVERRVYVDGEDLIIRETPEHLAEIESLLRNEGFMQKLVTNQLAIQAFSLIPRNALDENREYLQAFANRVVEQVRTFLYTQSGVAAAEAQGRRMWYDPNTLTLVIADFPDNISEVGAFLDSLPELKSEARFKVIYLKYALASDIEAQLGELLNIGGATAETAAEGELSVTKSLRRTDEFTWRDITVVVRRVTQGDPNDEYSDSCEVVVNVAGSRESTNLTLNELDVSQFVTDAQGGEYQLSADDIKPSGRIGEGRVRLTIRYVPPATALQGP